MIKLLQRNFIMVSMSAITIVLIVMIGVINIITYTNMNRTLDMRMDVIEENNGTFPTNFDKMKYPKTLDDGRTLSKESPFDTRFFTVTVDMQGNIVKVDIAKIVSVTEEEAKVITENLIQKKKQAGFVEQYKYKVIQVKDENNQPQTLYIFLSAERELATCKTFFHTSILIGVIGLAFVLIMIVLFSKIFLKPVAESYQKQKRFITDASHEIKTPLAIIGANIEVIEMESGESEWTASVRNQIKRLNGLVERLVFLSRMDEEKTSIQMTDFSLSTAIKENVEPFEALAKAQNKEIHMQIEEKLKFHGNEENIRQMINILLENALKYSSEKGVIDVKCQRDGKRGILLMVSNPVDQIKQGNLDILFERFYRTDESRSSKSGGYGIGLSVAQSIVIVHKGKIHAKSEDGKSITFEIHL